MGQLHSLKGNSGSTQGQQGPTRARFREVKCLHRLKKKKHRDFPGGPVVKAPSSQCRGHRGKGSTPGWAN